MVEGSRVMAHGRIETTPEQQLAALRLAYARYASLAERWKDSADPLIDAGEREARELDARRIAHAYEKSIESNAIRLQSMHDTHVDAHGLVSLAKGMGVMAAIALVLAGGAAAYLRPEILQNYLGAFEARIMPAATPGAPVTAPHVAATAPVVIAPARPAPVMAAPAVTPTPRQPFAASAVPKLAPPRPQQPAAAPPRPAEDKPQRLAAAGPRGLPASPPEDSAETRTLNEAYGVPRDPFRAEPPQPATLSVPQAALQPLPQVKLVEPDAAPANASTSHTNLVPVLRTHLLPPYPLDAKRAGEQGTTQMEVSISTLGAITDCRVAASSGSPRLDDTACSFVKRYWRWLPPTRDGQEVPATTKISVIWNLVAER